MASFSHIPAVVKLPSGSRCVNRDSAKVNVTRRNVSDKRRKLTPGRSEAARDRAAAMAVSSAEAEVVTSTIEVEGNTEQQSVRAERREIFDNIAPMYDQLNDWLSLGQHHIWKRMTVSWSRATRGAAVLDICCGSGDLAFLLAERVGPTGEVTGLDFAAQQLVVAAQRQRDSFSASQVAMRWIEGDALALPFSDDSFDAITMGYGLRNVLSISGAMEEMRRVLRPDCYAACLDFNNTTNPTVRVFQELMLERVVVPVASQFGLESEYKYLLPSIRRFPTGRELERLALDAGFSSAVHYSIAGDLMGVLVVRK